MVWTLCTSGSAVLRAGTHANSTIIVSGSALQEFSNEAEGSIEQDTNTSWVANYTPLSTSIKNALSNVAACRIAKSIIAYDPTGYLTREMDLLMNVNDDIETKGMKVLRGKPDKLKAP